MSDSNANQDRKIPNLFHVGVARTGTTSLYNYFMQHPDIYVPSKKELHFFSREIMADANAHNKTKKKHFVLNKDRYLGYFDDVGNEEIIADISPGDYFSEKSAERIFNFNPDAKIIFSFREPVDQMYSYHGALVSTFMEDENDFLLAIDPSREVAGDSWVRPSLYFDLVDYERHFNRFLDYFPTDQIFIYFYKNFKNDTAGVYKRLLKFLDVSVHEPEEFDSINSHRIVRFPLLVKIVEGITNTFDLSFLGKNPFAGKLAGVYVNVVTREEKRPNLPNNVKLELKKQLRPNVVRLEKLLKKNGFIEDDFDLKAFWGYDL